MVCAQEPSEPTSGPERVDLAEVGPLVLQGGALTVLERTLNGAGPSQQLLGTRGCVPGRTAAALEHLHDLDDPVAVQQDPIAPCLAAPGVAPAAHEPPLQLQVVVVQHVARTGVLVILRVADAVLHLMLDQGEVGVGRLPEPTQPLLVHGVELRPQVNLGVAQRPRHERGQLLLVLGDLPKRDDQVIAVGELGRVARPLPRRTAHLRKPLDGENRIDEGDVNPICVLIGIIGLLERAPLEQPIRPHVVVVELGERRGQQHGRRTVELRNVFAVLGEDRRRRCRGGNRVGDLAVDGLDRLPVVVDHQLALAVQAALPTPTPILVGAGIRLVLFGRRRGVLRHRARGRTLGLLIGVARRGLVPDEQRHQQDGREADDDERVEPLRLAWELQRARVLGFAAGPGVHELLAAVGATDHAGQCCSLFADVHVRTALGARDGNHLGGIPARRIAHVLPPRGCLS